MDSASSALPARAPRADAIASGILKGGVLASAAVIILGSALSFFGRATAAQAVSFPHTFSGVLTGLARLDPAAITVFGLLILLATPVAQVAVSIGTFLQEGNRVFAAIAAIVLFILLVSIVLVGGWLGSATPSVARDTSLGFFALLLASSVAAGFVGALVGLGGGIFIVPLLTLVFHVPFETAVGASIVSIIATSSGAAAVYVRRRLTNRRIGTFLEVATTLGAVCGALLTIVVLHASVLFIIFGLVLVASVVPLLVKLGEETPVGVTDDAWAARLGLAGSYLDERTGEAHAYQVARVPASFGMMYVAGLLSGLLGIGSGTFKVLAMDTAMRLPMRVSVTTSNFMIGVTAAASAGIFFGRGDIDPVLAAPIALGVLIGAALGAILLPRLSNAMLRMIFVPVVLLVALDMLARGFGLL